MTVLQPRSLHPDIASRQEMAAAGGLWLVENAADRAAVVAEVRERGIRALEVFGDLAFLAELPELEFLVAHDPPDVTPIRGLSKLRLLTFSGTWGGRLDGTAWPALEWFGAVEIPKAGGGVETLYGHPFENDDAADWRYLLVDGGGPEVVADALRAVVGGSPDLPDAANAVAAAAVVGAGLGVADVDLPDDVRAWLAAVDESAWPPLASEAVPALDLVLTESDPSELWGEAEDDSWAAETRPCATGSPLPEMARRTDRASSHIRRPISNGPCI